MTRSDRPLATRRGSPGSRLFALSMNQPLRPWLMALAHQSVGALRRKQLLSMTLVVERLMFPCCSWCRAGPMTASSSKCSPPRATPVLVVMTLMTPSLRWSPVRSVLHLALHWNFRPRPGKRCETLPSAPRSRCHRRTVRRLKFRSALIAPTDVYLDVQSLKR